MHKFRTTTVITLALVALGSACSDQSSPTAASADQVTAPDLSKKAKVKKSGLVLPVEGALSDGGSFKGTATITKFEYVQATNSLVAVGTLDGLAKPSSGPAQHVKDQAFSTPVELGRVGDVAAADATRSMYRTVQASCDVLFLDLGPLSLDLLGLTVDLSRIVLDVNAVTGAGNLLGNLLCGLLGLLDGFAILAQILDLLDTINDLLAGLGSLGGLVNYTAPATAATVLGVAAT